MKKRLLLFIPIFLIITGVLLFLRFANSLFKGEGGLQVTSNTQSKAYLNGKFIGSTPLCLGCNPEKKDTIAEGEYLLKLEPLDKTLAPFSFRIKIAKGVLTAVDRTFLPSSYASAFILTLEKIDQTKPQLLVISLPDKALVSIDNNPQDITPLLLKEVSSGEHEIELRKNGFAKKTIRLKTVPSYKLIAYVILGTESETTPTPSATPAPQTNMSVKIKNTPTGFLRVREKPSITSQELTRVQPGDIYPLLDEQEGWFKITLKDETTGWISSTFSEKVTSP